MRSSEIRELYEAAYRRLVVQLYAVTGDLAEAQDCVQEAFVRALAGHGPDVRNPEAWLRTVAVNHARRRWRRRRMHDRLLRAAAPQAPAAAADLGTEHAALIAALRALPRAQREVVALHHLADLPVAEVAEITRTPVGTVKARLSRGRTRLAELLGEWEERDANHA